MSHFGPLPDGCMLAPGMRKLVLAAETVTVVTNNRAVPHDLLQRLPAGDRDTFVVFNRHRFTLDDRLATRTVWVHRLDDASGRYFGEPDDPAGATPGFHHLRVAADDPRRVSVPAEVSYLSYRAPLSGLARYPVGRRLLVPQRGIRRIVSPSTGFAVFALLEELQRRGAPFTIRAIGVGREYDGWPGHDWKFERRVLRTSTIDFLTPDGRIDRWGHYLDCVPYDLVRAACKLTAWRSRQPG